VLRLFLVDAARKLDALDAVLRGEDVGAGPTGVPAESTGAGDGGPGGDGGLFGRVDWIMHQLKGASASTGLDRVARACSEARGLCLAGDLAGLRDLAARTRAALGEAEAGVGALLDALGGSGGGTGGDGG